jgi:uncharacterized protein
MTKSTIATRIATLDWARITTDLEARGVATTGALLSLAECTALTAMYADESAFRSHIIMARHGFGKGEYKYFSRPLPTLIDGLRASLYPQLAPVANRWADAMKLGVSYPPQLCEFLRRCNEAGQIRPTPLLLKYEAGDYNCLHQDLYGDNVFPLQVAFLLSRPGVDFEGGEFVLVEQRPRMQSRPEVVPLVQGEGVIFAVHNLRHGVSRVRTGQRFTTGIIFHDAK